jgi:hypothetical protein
MAAVFAASALFAASPAAWADDDSVYAPTVNHCLLVQESQSYLPVLRWEEGAGQILNNPNGKLFDMSSLISGSNMMLSSSSGTWATLTQMTEWVGVFCPAEKVGGAIDRAAATIGQMIVTTPIAVLAILFVVALALMGKRGGGWKALGQTLVALALIITMSGAAALSSGGGAGGDPDAPYTPGVMSPGWVATVGQKAVSWLTSVPAASIQRGLESAIPITSADPMSNKLGCAWYVNQLGERFRDRWTMTGVDPGLESAVPWSLSQLWLRSAAQTWKDGQFGGTDLADLAWCHLLDTHNTGSYTHAASTPQAVIGGPGAAGLQGAAWDTYTSFDDQAAQVSLWAGCAEVHGRSVDADDNPFNGPFDGDWPDGLWSYVKEKARAELDSPADACPSFFDSSIKGEDSTHTEDFWGTLTNKDVAMGSHATDAAQFAHAIYGESNRSFFGAVLSMVGAFLSLLAFGLMALGVGAGKLLILGCTLLVFIEILVGVVKLDPFGAVLRWVKTLLGMMAFVTLSGLVFSLTNLFSSVVVMLATGIGSSAQTLLAGLAPVAGVAMVVFMFKKLGLPNPLSITGALAYGKAASSVPGAMRGGMGSLSRLASAGMGLALGRGRKKPPPSDPSGGNGTGGGGTGGLAQQVANQPASADPSNGNEPVQVPGAQDTIGADTNRTVPTPVAPDGETSEDGVDDPRTKEEKKADRQAQRKIDKQAMALWAGQKLQSGKEAAGAAKARIAGVPRKLAGAPKNLADAYKASKEKAARRYEAWRKHETVAPQYKKERKAPPKALTMAGHGLATSATFAWRHKAALGAGVAVMAGGVALPVGLIAGGLAAGHKVRKLGGWKQVPGAALQSLSTTGQALGHAGSQAAHAAADKAHAANEAWRHYQAEAQAHYEQALAMEQARRESQAALGEHVPHGAPTTYQPYRPDYDFPDLDGPARDPEPDPRDATGWTDEEMDEYADSHSRDSTPDPFEDTDWTDEEMDQYADEHPRG